eukprot:symbB.v1.2.009366.t1/scaffold592.1/size209785/7
MPAGPTSVARQPPTMAPWAQAAKAAPTPAPWAQTPQPPSPWNTSAALVPVAPAPAPAPAVQWLANQADDPWGTYEVPNQATPYPALEMGQESGAVAVIEEVDC